MAIATLPNFNCHYIQMVPDGWPDAVESPRDIVMIHGLATNLAFWYPVATALSQVYRVTLFDLRGHGKSSMPALGYTCQDMATDLADLLAFLEVRRTILISHSFGGGVALRYVQQHPNQIEHLVLADVRLKVFQPRYDAFVWPNWHQIAPRLAKLGIVFEPTETEAGYRLLTEIARAQLQQPEILQPLAALLPQIGSTRTAEQWIKLIDTTQAWQDLCRSTDVTLRDLKQLRMPVLAIYGEFSPTLPTAYALQAIWPSLSLDLIPGAGHFFPASQPQSLIQSVQRFLQ